MSNLVDISFELPKWNDKLRKALPELYRTIAASMQTNRGEMFDAEGAHNGKPKWASLKFRQGQILSKRGDLRKSFAPYNAKGTPGAGGFVKISGGLVTVGTGLIMAKLLSEGTAGLPGGVLKPTHAQALKIPLPAGKQATPLAKSLRKSAKSNPGSSEKFMFRKSVKIPARPMDELTNQDALEIEETVMNAINEVLSR